MKGWRTLILNGLALLVPVLLQYLAGVNWADYVDPKTAAYIVIAVNMVMRAVTSTPLGRKE